MNKILLDFAISASTYILLNILNMYIELVAKIDKYTECNRVDIEREYSNYLYLH